MPFDPMWQFMSNPIDHSDFENSDYSKLSISGNFSYNDSIDQYFKDDDITRLKKSTKRMLASDSTIPLVLEWLHWNRLSVSYSDYNEAVEIYNSGVKIYDDYRIQKSKRFKTPKVSDSQIKNIISTTENSIRDASEILKKVVYRDDELERSYNDLCGIISEARSNLEKEKIFVNRYTST